jgi:hypothetical protein
MRDERKVRKKGNLEGGEVAGVELRQVELRRGPIDEGDDRKGEGDIDSSFADLEAGCDDSDSLREGADVELDETTELEVGEGSSLQRV